MLRALRRSYGPLLVGVSTSIATSALSSTASAHVKWFCAYDVAGQPDGLGNVLCADFEQLVGLALAVLMAASLVDGTEFGAALLRALGHVMDPIRRHSEILIRATCGFFFICLWFLGGIILTPELHTDSAFIPCLQLAIAAGMLWRPTLVLSAAGIVALFATATWYYGAFHLMDYPIFLGLAGYLALTGLGRTVYGARPLDIARWATSITLMWASIEKWAYPEWSYPLFVSHPALTMGFQPDFFMRAAGVVEFGLSFALIWTPLCRRAAAIILAGIFVSAIAEFGKIDAIGHAPIIVLVLAIGADTVAAPASRWRPLWAPLCFVGALAGFLIVYYALHSMLFGTTFT